MSLGMCTGGVVWYIAGITGRVMCAGILCADVWNVVQDVAN